MPFENQNRYKKRRYAQENVLSLFINGIGTPVKLPGVGTFTPYVNREGVFKVGFRADAQLKKLLNGPEGFEGRMKNQANIGISNEDLKALWDADHPDDPLEI